MHPSPIAVAEWRQQLARSRNSAENLMVEMYASSSSEDESEKGFRRDNCRRERVASPQRGRARERDGRGEGGVVQRSNTSRGTGTVSHGPSGSMRSSSAIGEDESGAWEERGSIEDVGETHAGSRETFSGVLTTLKGLSGRTSRVRARAKEADSGGNEEWGETSRREMRESTGRARGRRNATERSDRGRSRAAEMSPAKDAHAWEHRRRGCDAKGKGLEP